jgi:hypothetical protein
MILPEEIVLLTAVMVVVSVSLSKTTYTSGTRARKSCEMIEVRQR